MTAEAVADWNARVDDLNARRVAAGFPAGLGLTHRYINGGGAFYEIEEVK